MKTRRRSVLLGASAVAAGALAKRHMNERNQPDSRRVWHEDIGSRRPDEPVDECDGAVRNPLHHAGERRVGRSVRTRPRAGHGVHLNRPAHLG